MISKGFLQILLTSVCTKIGIFVPQLLNMSKYQSGVLYGEALEALYNDAEIGTNNFTNTGFEISAIGVYVSTLGSPTLASGFKIWMKNTTTNSFAVSNYSTSGYTLVYNGSINPTSTGFYKILLNFFYVKKYQF